MRILIVSDTHKQNQSYLDVIEKEQPIDMVIHCGDGEGSEVLLTQAVSCPVYIVAGNNDFFSEIPKEVEIPIYSYKVWVTHGHNYYVSMNNATIKAEAKSRGMDIVCYGHTHKPLVEEEKGFYTINPGSLTYPRQEGRQLSYIIMECEEGEKPIFTVKYL